MNKKGPFARLMERDEAERRIRTEATQKILDSLPPWSPIELRTMIEIFAPSRDPQDIVLAGHLYTLASAPAMQKVWDRVSDPTAIKAVAITAASSATHGPGAFGLSPVEVEARCDAIRESITRLNYALRAGPTLQANDQILESKLRALYDEAKLRGRADKDKGLGRRDRKMPPKGRVPSQKLRAFEAEASRVLILHGQENPGGLVAVLTAVLFGELDERRTRRNAARGRTDLSQK